MSSSSSDGETSSDIESKKVETNSSGDDHYHKESDEDPEIIATNSSGDDHYHKESDEDSEIIETNSSDSDHSHEESDKESETVEINSSNDDSHGDSDVEVKEIETSLSDDFFYRENSYQECDRSISSSDSDILSNSCPSEYCIEIERNWSDYDSDCYVPVVGLKYSRVICRDNLSKLLKSDKPKYKGIVNSIATDAAIYNNYDAFERLLFKKYKLQILNDKGQTALHLAFYHNSHCVISEFSDCLDYQDSSQPGREPDRADYVDCNGLTHLHVASAYGSYSLVENYLENDNYVNARFRDSACPSMSGFTPLHFAVMNMSKYYNASSTQELIAHGADVNAVDDQGRTPLHLVSQLSVSFRSKYFDGDYKEMMKIIEVLVESKSDVNAQDNNGNTPLFMIFTTMHDKHYTDPKLADRSNVCFEDAEQKLQFLLKFNVDLTLKNKSGNTLLHQVIESLKFLRYSYFNKPDCIFNDSRHVEMIKLILNSEKNIDIDAKNDNGETPLQLAVSYLSLDIVQLLLEHNADVRNLKLSSGIDNYFKYTNTALSLKPVQHLIDILELLGSEGFVLNLEENLTILKFLTHSNGKCICVDMNYFKSHRIDIFHMMCLDLPEHVDKILQKLYVRLDEYDPFDEKRSLDSISSLATDMLDILNTYFLYLKIGNIHVDPKAIKIMETALKRYETVHEFGFKSAPDEKMLKGIMKDIGSLKSIFLINDVSLHDVLMKNPEETVKYFMKNNFDENCMSNLAFLKDIVKGHATKSLIKYYVQKFAYVYVGMLSENPLYDICCLQIVRYLSVKDVLNVSLALNV